MKEQFKKEELAATATDIRDAVRSKSITADMVGGTLLALVNAVGEVVETLGEIPREHVKVKVRGYDGTGGVSGAGATVWLDVFNTSGYPAVAIPRQELTADEEGVVEFDVPHGFKYAVFSQIDGLGASFQLVETAASERRELALWNMPVGVYALWQIAINPGDGSPTRCCPFVASHYIEDWDEQVEAGADWDVNPDSEDEDIEDICLYGILVSTADTSFVIADHSKAEDTMVWCGNRDYATAIPTMPMINNKDTDESWEDLQNRARADMDGNMNTAKILSFCHNPVAANYCTEYMCYFDEQRFLPSGGQASIMQANRIAINALMTEINEGYNEIFDLLPYQKPNNSWDHYEWWWTSTIYDEFCSWVVDYNGFIDGSGRNLNTHVRAVSAFHFEY